jgi:hypothetical protein
MKILESKSIWKKDDKEIFLLTNDSGDSFKSWEKSFSDKQDLPEGSYEIYDKDDREGNKEKWLKAVKIAPPKKEWGGSGGGFAHKDSPETRASIETQSICQRASESVKIMAEKEPFVDLKTMDAAIDHFALKWTDVSMAVKKILLAADKKEAI